MIVIMCIHVAQFCIQFRIYSYDVKLSSQEVCDTLTDEVANYQENGENNHYKKLNRQFNSSGVYKWAVFGGLHIIAMIVFLIMRGKEAVFFLYIPLDFAMTCALAIFYFYFLKLDKDEKEKEAAVQEAGEVELKDDIKKQITQAFL